MPDAAPRGFRQKGRRFDRRPFFSFLALLFFFQGCGDRPVPAASTRRVPPPADAANASNAADTAAQGKWRKARRPPSPVSGAAADVRAIPYLQGYKPAAGNLSTVVVHDPKAVDPGLNLYVSGHAAEAVLMDMDGKVLHRWRYPLRRLWPDLAADPTNAKLEYWRRAYLFPNGDLLGIYEGLGLVKLDAQSRVLWARRGGFHHDLSVTPDGEIWVLYREGRIVPRINPKEGILEDMVAVLGPDGRMRRKISLLAAFERSPYAFLLGRMERSGDTFHTNTLELLDGRLAGRDPAFREGNVLLSVLKLDTLAILDPERGSIVWAKTGEWRRQHQPTFLDNGDLLLFDNGGAADRSRVLEIDPLSGAVHWQFGGGRGQDLFSKTLGSCQRLPNGDTLITESESGRALEVTPDKRIVWEFNNPHRAGNHNELVAVLFEMVRLPRDWMTWTKKSG
jgi:Arylsulfotransferase (ASST)